MSQSLSDLTIATYNWIVQRPDGVGFATTSQDQRQQVGSMSLEADMDLKPSNLILRDRMYGSRLELGGGLSSPALRLGDLTSGRWNGSTVRLLASDWHRDGDAIPICNGELDKVVVEGGEVSMSIDLLPPAIRRPPCIQTSPECRAVLGDRHCRIDMRTRRTRLCVIKANANELTVDVSDIDGYAMGRLRWISGANCGVEQSILSTEGNKLLLHDVPEFPIKAGDRAIAHQGCDGRRTTCAERFGNILNFRGEPDLPGSEILMRFPGA
ncbi:phage BR0599 family protein [Sphingomonas kaistensis]|uniref:Phage BR0599 family protein n=1 Tax=Sphingomonas kaistensis TaxID=298708 RepID=A0ABZ2G5W3_9SPHN